jgi:predicted class III extradiol MEMO1 family dioxygenase
VGDMTTSDIRSETVKAQVDAENYRRAVRKLCDDYDKLLAASTDLLHFLHSEPADILDIPDEIYVPFTDALDRGE